MTIGLDTSVLVRLLAGSPRHLALAALSFLIKRREAGDSIQVSDLVFAETYYALQYHYGVSKRDALAALRQLLDTPEIKGVGHAAEVLATPDLESAKPGFVDRLIHSGYRRSGVEEFATFEKAAAKLPGTIVLTA